MTNHMGVNLRGSETDLFLSKENYLTVTKKNSFDNPTYEYSDEWCEQHKANCYMNYDLNMKYFASLDHRDFDKEVMKYVKKQKFTPCMDLNHVNEVEGIYMMILDRYSQAYVGTSENIKRRIMSHWTKKMPFDRLLFPMNGISTSKLSINSFRALDTTLTVLLLHRKGFVIDIPTRAGKAAHLSALLSIRHQFKFVGLQDFHRVIIPQ